MNLMKMTIKVLTYKSINAILRYLPEDDKMFKLFGHREQKSFVNYKKYENAILYFASSCEKVGKLKLAKLLYFSDFNHFEKYLESITNTNYIHQKYGPVPEDYWDVINTMLTKKLIKIDKISTEYEHEFEKIIPLKKPNLKVFTKEELETIKKVVDNFKSDNAEQMKEKVNQDFPCIITAIGESIPYQLAVNRECALQRV